MVDYFPRIPWNLKFYFSKIGRKYAQYGNKLENQFDKIKDNKICGCSLVKYVPSLYRESMGATGSQSTHYYFLENIFKNADFNKKETFLDVGCGKGRVLAFLISKKAKWDIHGIELNSDVAQFAKNWVQKYDNADILHGDAFQIDFNSYTVMSLGRPFEPEAFKKFIDKVESELTHPFTLYYWWDSQSGNYLNNRPGWELKTRKWFFKHLFIPIEPTPQRYSVLTFTPECCR